MGRRAALLIGALAITACGSPAAPSPTVTGIAITCPQADVFLGASMACTSAVSQSNGQSRDVTASATWLTETPTLVTMAGAQLTARASGQALIRASAEGQTTARQVRTYPNYAAKPFPFKWTVTSCTQNGSLAQADICSGTPVGSTGTATALFGQTNANVTAQIGGFGLPLTNVTGTIAVDGSLDLSLSGTVASLTQDQRWRLNSLDGLALTGTVTLTWRDPQTNSTATVDFLITAA